MRLQPRQQLLDIWDAVVRFSWTESGWAAHGRFGSNSISDAEQILCLLLPATEIDILNLHQPDRTGDRVVQVLRRLGTASDIPRIIIQILDDYFARYTEGGTPIFSGGDYYEVYEDAEESPTKEQASLPVVESFACSITLSLVTLRFIQAYRRSVAREDTLRRLDELEGSASIRLSAAMVGLLRSFTVQVFPADSPEGARLCDAVDPGGWPRRTLVSRLRHELRETIACLRDVLIDSELGFDLEDPDRLFECGWSWTVVRSCPTVETSENVGEQRPGVGRGEPNLYFTTTVLRAVECLFSPRTRSFGLLNEEQQRLARALQLRSDLTIDYWATLALFGDGTVWPIENVPWPTTGGEQSDYSTLQMASIAIMGLARRRDSDNELARVGRVLTTLAGRGRITTRAVEGDPNLSLHDPGVRIRLRGSDEGLDGGELLLLSWSVPDFAPLLMLRSAHVASLISDPGERRRMLGLCDEVWDHLFRRRLRSAGEAGLWDDPSSVYAGLARSAEVPSWYYTERVVEALVEVAQVLDRPPTRNDELMANALNLLGEAEQIFDRELLHGGLEAGPRLRDTLRIVGLTLDRAGVILAERPATAAALVFDCLRQLDLLDAARGGIGTEGG